MIYRESLNRIGAHEYELGVATNRALAQRQRYAGSTTPSSQVTMRNGRMLTPIDIENDPLLRDFLEDVKNGLSEAELLASDLERAQAAIREVVAHTIPYKDYSNFWERHGLPFGLVLKEPVLCNDRAVAMEAVVKMVGITEAQTLSLDIKDSPLEAHADFTFTAGGIGYIAVTMGERAGQVFPQELYHREHLPWIAAQGGGERTISVGGEDLPYFESVILR